MAGKVALFLATCFLSLGELEQVLAAPLSLHAQYQACLLYTSPSPRDATLSRMPSSA